jgi:hypothetical protein
MKRGAWLLLAIGASCDLRPNDAELRTGMTEEEMNAPPGHHHMRAAITNDVRRWRMLDTRLEEGRPTCPSLYWEEKVARCARDKEALEVYSIRHDLPDQPYRVEETAYFCRTEGLYFYHYVGGKKKSDVWMGPFPLERRRVKPDQEQ